MDVFKTCISGLIFSGMALSAMAQTAPSLRELTDSAVAHNYELKNKKIDIRDTEIDQKKLQEAYLPRVSVSGKEAFLLSSFGVNTPEIQIPPLNIDIKKDRNTYTSTSNLLTAQAEAEILLYSGGKVPALKKALAEKKNAQTAILEKDVMDIRSAIAQAYDQLALLKQVKMLLDDSKRRLDANKETADKAFGYGLITKYEHQKIEIAQAQLQSKNLEYEGKRALVIKQLHILTNIDVARLELIDHELQPMMVDVQAGSIENRAEIKALDASISAARYKMNAESKWFVPKVQAATSLGYVGLSGGHLRSKHPLLPFGTHKLSVDMPNLKIFPMWTIGIGFRWDLFDGNTGRRAVEKAALEVEKAENKQRDAREKLELNLANTRTNYEIANAKIVVKEREKNMAANALDQATREYRVGLIKSSQLIDAENDLQNASMEYAQAVFDQRRAAMELLKATASDTYE